MASRSVSPTDRAHRPEPGWSSADGAARPHGLPRIWRMYGVSLLAAVLGLPVLAAGLITANSCALRGGACSGRLGYGVVGAVALAALVQLVLVLHLRLGWSCWAAAAAVTATVVLHLDQPVVVLLTVIAAPGIGAWVSEPPTPYAARTGGRRLLRPLVLTGVLAATVVPGLLLRAA